MTRNLSRWRPTPKVLAYSACFACTNDLWIAALVLQHDFALYARDQHFDHLPQLVRI